MIWAIAALVVGLVLTGLGIYWFGDYNMEGWGIVSGILGGFLALGGALFLILVPVTYHFDSVECDKFEQQTTYETKMVRYYWTGWTCMAKLENDRWLPKDQLRDIDQ